MSSTKTADEVREHYIEKMGPSLGLVFYRLWNETTWLHIKWHTYVALFGTSTDRVALLNQAAPMSFRVVQDSCGMTSCSTYAGSPIHQGRAAKRISP